MSKISIKKDFLDGTTLPAVDLNNNFMVIEAGINANEETLQEVIDEAITRLDHELEEITADRGWDWNGGNRVTFYKGDTDAIEARAIINGQLLYNTETGETALDDSNNRIVTGSGNVVAIGEIQPTNPATKLWVQPSKMARYAASYVVNDMTGDDTDKAPSVNAVKEYVDEKHTYSTTEHIVGKWYNGKPIYSKTLILTNVTPGTTSISHGISNLDDIIKTPECAFKRSTYLWEFAPSIGVQGTYNIEIYDLMTNIFKLYVGSGLTDVTKLFITLYYTKTTD